MGGKSGMQAGEVFTNIGLIYRVAFLSKYSINAMEL